MESMVSGDEVLVRLRGARLLVTILLPAVAPAVFSGLRLGLAHSWLYPVAAELIASDILLSRVERRLIGTRL